MEGGNITFKYRYRKQIIIGIIAFCLVFLVSVLVIVNLYKNDLKSDEEIVIKKNTKNNDVKEESVEEYKVDIKGEVLTPGIYTLKSSSRVIDVIEKAGGLTEQADTSVINLSKKITDEMVIIIYSYEEVNEFEQTKKIEEQVQEKCVKSDENSLENDACIESGSVASSTATNKVSINTGTIEELMTLPGIGEAKAKEIINYRDVNGNFNSIEDIKNVSGIGDSIFEKIKDNITT